jgi:hypothetical protein
MAGSKVGERDCIIFRSFFLLFLATEHQRSHTLRGKKRSREMEIKSSRERENCSNPGSEKQKRDAARRAKSKNKEDFS